MFKSFSLALVAMALVSVAHAEDSGFDFNAIGKQLMANPAVQQQVATTAANNPQLVSQFANSLTPAQQTTLSQQALEVAKQMLTPAEQTALTQFQSTPEGAGVMAKLPAIIQQLAPTLLQMYAAQTATQAPAAGK